MVIKFYLWTCAKMVLVGNRGLGSTLERHSWRLMWLTLRVCQQPPSPPCPGQTEQTNQARMALGADRDLRNY